MYVCMYVCIHIYECHKRLNISVNYYRTNEYMYM